MARLVEYYNPNPYLVRLIGPDKRQIVVPRYSKIVLSDWFISRYTPKYLRVIRIINGTSGTPKQTPSPSINRIINRPKVVNKSSTHTRSSNTAQIKPRTTSIIRPKQPSQRSAIIIKHNNSHNNKTTSQNIKPVVGHKMRGDVNNLYKHVVESDLYPISNNIGVGILSYNRLNSLQRLIESIRRTTDLSRTTIFVSDESTKQEIKEWLRQQHDIVAIDNSNRLGIAGNSNRLLRCLARFKYKILLNDDVEVLQPGWETFYFDAMVRTGFHHFCFRQPGIYGATQNDATVRRYGDVIIKTVNSRPHGSVMAFDHIAFEAVGYFDESFGIYGMEHVDWSLRVERSKIQPAGYHDVAGSEQYFKIWDEPSAVEERHKHYNESKKLFQQLSSNPSRIRIEASHASNVPSVSYVIPLRNIDRSRSIATVVANIRAQHFPCIDINLMEQDKASNTDLSDIIPCNYKLVQNNDHFNKALAFNHGVVQAKNEIIILHDADIMVPANYTRRIWDIMQSADGCHIGAKVLYLTRESTNAINEQHKATKGMNCEHAVDYFEGGSLAVKKSIYKQIGGFDENFIGYGVEDCEFYDRLKKCTQFKEDRYITMIHLWHGRVPGWEERHRANREYLQKLHNMFTVSQRADNLRRVFQSRYNI